ncbi:hypothetical protein MAN88_51730 [Microcystis aeruginosa]|nr:hypothetical protein MAN88_51730 [Microcystis aeruginosa]
MNHDRDDETNLERRQELLHVDILTAVNGR